MTGLLDTLTDEQRAAAESKDAEVIVSAGAGSGKTSVLAARVVHLIAHEEVDPREVLVLTFTRAACAEIRSRIVEALGFAVEPVIRTFHAHAASIVQDGRRVATEAESEAALRSLYEGPMRRAPRGRPGIEELRAAIVRHEANGWTGATELPSDAAVRIVLSRLAYANLTPTWDLVPAALAWRDPHRYAHVLVDELQDASPAEIRFATGQTAGDLFMVGDPRQAIFGWRGALGMVEKPTHRLTRTFRFGQAVADIANQLAARFGGEPIEGAPEIPNDYEVLVPGTTLYEFFDALRAEVENEHWAGATLVLARTNRECQAIVRACQGTVHVTRDPLDPLSSERDRFREAWERGLTPVSTCHGAKGAEADRVVLVRDLEAKQDEPAEERVSYVGCTRARRRLVLVAPPPGFGGWK